ncbi:MAG TPA: DUF4097 family beta strand repeat-containing protein [Blastocatellia bacterium]|nr:DUF4097 family beta strand repeat-containing protein [Blastocatellia bacterium]
MIKPLIRFVALSAFLSLVMITTAAAQDFKKSYNLGAGGQIRVSNISGNVSVKGYNGSEVIVTGIKKGRDQDKLEIEDESTGNSVEIGVQYPKNCNCEASVNFEVQVPRSVRFEYDRISSVSGNVDLFDVMGKVEASSVSGNVRVKGVTGHVSATSVSGNVDVEVNRLDGSDDLEFSSVSGNVNVRMPSSLDANVDMSSFSGDLTSDFPVEIKKKRYGSGSSAHARLGSGARQLSMKSVSGNVNLLYSREQ